MIKIACIGAPSTGKSTTAAELKKIVEKRNVVEYISAGQFLKSCGYGINEDGSKATGKACVLFHKISVATMDLIESNDIMVLPRTIIDPIAYDDIEVSEEDVKEYFSHIDFVFYFPIETKIEKREMRTDNEDFRSSIDVKLKELAAKYGIKWIELKGNPHEKAEKVKSLISEKE